MFAKLLKYEFRSVWKPLTIISVAALVAGLVGMLLMELFITNISLEGQDNFAILSILVLGGIYVGLIAYSIGCPVILYYRFYKNKFTDEGYLTFTLPVSVHQILLSSALNIVIWSAIQFVVLIISFGLIVSPIIGLILEQMTYYDTQMMVQEITQQFPIATQLLSLVCGGVYSVILPMISITIGALITKKHKILASFAIGYGIHMAVSTVSSFSSLTVMISQNFFTMESVYPYNFGQILSSSIILPSLLMLIIGIGGYFLMHYLISKKLNL